MLKSALRCLIAQKPVHRGNPVLYEAGIRIGVDPKRRQRYDNLGDGFAAGTVLAGEIAVFILQSGQDLNRRIQRSLHCRVALPVGSQRLDRHAGHIRIRDVAGVGPAAF